MDGTSKKGKFYRFTAAELARGVRQPDGAVAKVAALRAYACADPATACIRLRDRAQGPETEQTGVRTPTAPVGSLNL